MIIRSKDGHGFVNFENIDTVCISTEWEIVTFSGNVKSYLGQYSTEEKAIKVLDMICRAYEYFRGGNVYEHSVFQMPQDSEV